MSRHRVKTHHWLSGTLRAREFFFETLEDAMSFVKGGDHHSAKIFDNEGQMVHESTKNHNTNSYA
jgi:hypothetical protein